MNDTHGSGGHGPLRSVFLGFAVLLAALATLLGSPNRALASGGVSGICGSVFIDRDCNGVLSASESNEFNKVQDVVVTLTELDAITLLPLAGVAQETVTTGNTGYGNYCFHSL